MLAEIGVDVTPPKGTIYVWAPVPEGHSSASYCELVLEESGVVVSPGSSYGPNGEGFFRISLTVPDERLARRSSGCAPVWEARQVHYCGVVPSRAFLQLAMLEEVREADPRSGWPPSSTSRVRRRRWPPS